MLQKSMTDKEKLEKLNEQLSYINEQLSSIRKSLPYEDQDPKKNRMLGIEQMKLIHTHLLSQGIGLDVLSPYRTILSALDGLESGRKSKLLKPRPVKIQGRDMMFYAMSAAAFDFLRRAKKDSKYTAATQVLKLMKKHSFPALREQSANTSSDERKSRKDQRSSEDGLIEWTKACRNRKKGESAKESYNYYLDLFTDHLNATDLKPGQIIEKCFEISKDFEDLDPYRVVKPPIS